MRQTSIFTRCYRSYQKLANIDSFSVHLEISIDIQIYFEFWRVKHNINGYFTTDSNHGKKLKKQFVKQSLSVFLDFNKMP